jgi:hypothetical protein
VGQSLSSIIELTSGVVQGSVLGPLLFVLFINDITDLFADNNCKCKLFADDLKLYTVLETSTDCALLQGKLNELYDWCNKWQLTISYKKCNVMFVGNSTYNVTFNINANVLDAVDKVKDLGVIVDAKLTFSDHINQLVKRAFIRSNLICKCFISRNVDNLLQAFLVYVRPILEYASCVWSPHYIGDIQKIESVQRRFTKRLPGYDTLDYKSRLTKLGIESLEMRRLRQDLIFTYKIVFGLVNQTADNFFTLSSAVQNVSTRGHIYKLFPSHSRIDVRKFFFANRVLRPWNSLPAEDKHFRNLTAFKTFIKTVNLAEFTTLKF